MTGGNNQAEFEPQIVTLNRQGAFTHEFGPAFANRKVRLAIELLQAESEFRGSRKHVLDFLGSPDWPQRLQEIIGIDEIQLAEAPCPKPGGHHSVAEADLDDYIHQFCAAKWPGVNQLNHGKWWAPNGGTRPQMDLICQIRVGGKDGLLFVEAKAHEGELDWGGKSLADDASAGSVQNHENIRQQIEFAKKGLNELPISGFNLTITSHYQLVNRLTYLWKLASVGVPVVLMYLGFTSDKYFATDFIQDDRHWQRIMGGYLQGVVPHGFPESEFPLKNGASLRMIIRSCDISPS